ncbi:MAG: hypothetical protein AB7F43_15525, partial [Bacteriovoracia bacterium]
IDSQFQCLDSNVAERYVRDFNIDVRSFGGLELCNSKVETKKLFNDIEILEKGIFSNQGENKFIRGFVDQNAYYSWLKNETRGIERGNDVPYAVAYNSGGYFTMQDGWAKSSTLGRVGTFVHEARHTAGYRHIICNQGPYKNTRVYGCDSNYSYGGSHAVEMEYYARVSVQGVNFHPVYKKMARLMAIARSNVFFNAPVISQREALLLWDKNKKLSYLHDQNQWFERETPAVEGRLKRSSFGAVLFDGVKAFAIELYQNSGFTDLVEDTYSYFKLILERGEVLKDLEEFDWNGKRYVLKVTQDNKIALYDFANGTWGRSFQLPFEFDRSSLFEPQTMQRAYYLIAKNQEVYAYDFQNQRLVKMPDAWNNENQDLVLYQGQSLMRDSKGVIYKKNGSAFEPWITNNQEFGGMTLVPIYDGFEVSKQ